MSSEEREKQNENGFITDDYYSLYDKTQKCIPNNSSFVGMGYLRLVNGGMASATLGELHIFPFTSKGDD